MLIKIMNFNKGIVNIDSNGRLFMIKWCTVMRLPKVHIHNALNNALNLFNQEFSRILYKSVLTSTRKLCFRAEIRYKICISCIFTF